MGIIVYFVHKSKKKGNKWQPIIDSISNANVEKMSLQGELNFSVVLNWFRSLNLDKEKDVPFMADASKMKNMLSDVVKSDEFNNKVVIFLGVYDEKEGVVSHARVLFADALDSKTKEVLGNESLVVLS
ncbi:MAG: hypothetical protein HUK15_06220 [Bacteroidales bacterium]|nr:hypothetical protein [Bacteroidales bacterium]